MDKILKTHWERLKPVLLAAPPPVNPLLVGYGWMKMRRQLINETSVSGHFRWQPHGPNLSKVKLIWINEHLRKYNTEDTHV